MGPILVTEIGVINPKQRSACLLTERLSARWQRIRLRLARELVGRFWVQMYILVRPKLINFRKWLSQNIKCLSTRQNQKDFLFSKTFRPAMPPLSVPLSCFFPQGMKLATYLHLVPLLRMSRALPMLPLYAFTAWHRHDFAFACKCLFARGPYAASTRPSVPVTNCDCPSTLTMPWRQEEAPTYADLGEKKRKDGHSPLVSAICHRPL